ncbi:hypothetical protein [Stutzerimonas tarimensis]|uniref:Alpha/beta hydrolase n=1 Tax=Stutzerimonas tarimensis TaxID=1507735 RepID=A0ABV7T7Z3_9GAMM
MSTPRYYDTPRAAWFNRKGSGPAAAQGVKALILHGYARFAKH